MYLRIIRNDLSRSKLITLTTMIFVGAAAMLVSLAAILVVNLTGSIDTLMKRAETPHFMQMHSGELNMPRLTEFAANNRDIDQFQVLEFLNMDGARIQIGEHSLADSVQDHGFSVQSGKFDYLLDLDGQVIDVSDGELYVPVNYMRDHTAKAGDNAIINGQEFTIAGFLRDSQMNSMLSSSKRFLVSANDYEALKPLGSMEYLIEFRLKDLSALGAFEAAYASAGLEANGPAITYPLIRMLNAISDGIMIGVILIVSILVVAIALMCIRFTLLAKIEEDYREIGVMKAIGLRVTDIKKLYLVKYAVVAAAGSMLGYVLSLVFKGMLLENIRLYMGESDKASAASLFGIIGVLLVFLAIIAYVNRVLRRLRKISAAEAIRFGIAKERAAGGRFVRLSNNRLLGTNVFLGVKDVLARKKLYTTMLVVLIISSFIMIVPQNLHSTISSKSFIEYMGIGGYDIRMDIQQKENMAGHAADIVAVLSRDNAIAQYAVLETKTFKTKAADGSESNVKVELGDHSAFPIAYSEGGAPASAREIALSKLNADELGKKVGDPMTLIVAGQEQQLTVSGIYSDITNGGKTAKASFEDHLAETMWIVICAELLNKAQLAEKIFDYTEKFRFAKISDIDAFIAQTFGSTIRSVEKASYAAIVVALMLTVLITLLFMKMLIAKDRYSIAVMRAFGFTDSDVRAQYVARSALVLLAGLALGTLLANTLGELLAGAAISSFGASTFRFEVNSLSAYLLSPAMMVGTVLMATIIGISGAGRIKISEHIKG